MNTAPNHNFKDERVATVPRPGNGRAGNCEDYKHEQEEQNSLSRREFAATQIEPGADGQDERAAEYRDANRKRGMIDRCGRVRGSGHILLASVRFRRYINAP
jgi:hypothetical protein